MESQPQNPEFRNNPENFHPCHYYNYTNMAHAFNIDISLNDNYIIIISSSSSRSSSSSSSSNDSKTYYNNQYCNYFIIMIIIYLLITIKIHITCLWKKTKYFRLTVKH